MYWRALTTRYAEMCRLVALCDMNQARMDYANRSMQELFDAEPVPTYKADQFDQMIAEQKPDVVIVTSIDRTHHI